MELSDSVTHMNGRQRKPAVPQGDMRGGDRVLNTTPDMDMEVEGEALHQGYDAEDNGHPRVRPGIRGELGNVSLLLFLYVLQGIPLGLAGSIPLILQSKNVSYKDQAFFSFVFWPFSLKLLWAPLVDALYLTRFGRRKSWLVPTQYLLGLFMLYLSVTVDTLLKRDQGRGPDVVTLTTVFFMLAFLAATQDIAVDGWALTMLSRENVGYASTCNSVGQTAGYFLGNVLFLALESADFCNTYLRAEPKETGIVTLSGSSSDSEGVDKGLHSWDTTHSCLSPPYPQVALYSMYVACMAFHAKVSDPVIGGTYMTLLNTVTNLGGNWPSTLALWMVDPLTSKECQGAAGQSCGSSEELCVKEGGLCVTSLDGYYVESVVCVVIGLTWWVWLGKRMRRLQDQSPAAWRCRIGQ
uniref:Solute carrier family 33 member 1 n=1 Tax=Hucho hucho TaxID=62062 RepID=A0A4W5LA40_9TELE